MLELSKNRKIVKLNVKKKSFNLYLTNINLVIFILLFDKFENDE